MAYNTAQAAAYLGYSQGHLRVLARGGAIAYSKPSRNRMLFLKEDLDEFILRNRHEGGRSNGEAIKLGEYRK